MTLRINQQQTQSIKGNAEPAKTANTKTQDKTNAITNKVLIGAGILATIAVAGIAICKGKKKKSTGISEIEKSVDETINELKQKFIEVYKIYEKTESDYNITNKAYSDEGGVINYFQRVLGFSKYDSNEYSEFKNLNLKTNQLLYGVKRGIKKAEEALSKPVAEENNYEFLFKNAGYSENLKPQEKIDFLTKHIALKNKGIEELHNNPNNSQYLNLHNETKLLGEKYNNFNVEGIDAQTHKRNLSELAVDIEKTLKNNGIEVVYDPKKIDPSVVDRLFNIYDGNFDNVPALFRLSDGYVYEKGKLLPKFA